MWSTEEIAENRRLAQEAEKQRIEEANKQALLLEQQKFNNGRNSYCNQFSQSGPIASLSVVQAVIKIPPKRFKAVGPDSPPHAFDKINKKIDIMNRVQAIGQ